MTGGIVRGKGGNVNLQESAIRLLCGIPTISAPTTPTKQEAVERFSRIPTDTTINRLYEDVLARMLGHRNPYC